MKLKKKKPKTNRSKEIIKFRTKINKLGNGK